MSFSIGIIGLPNAGKSTLFKALTKKEVLIGSRPFTTIVPNISRVEVPDERLKKLAELIGPEKVTPTTIEFMDIAGLVRKAYLGEGLGNQFLAQIRGCDGLIEVVRAFEDGKVTHLEASVNPQRDIEIIKTELLMKDFETLENFTAKSKNRDLEKIKEGVSKGLPVTKLFLNPEQEKVLSELQLLTAKPIIYLFNTNGENLKSALVPPPFLKINLKLEEEMSELLEEEAQELSMRSRLPELILACYRLLKLITFYTIAGGKEVRAWTLRRGSKAGQAGGQVHSDFARRFIRAEVINCDRLIEAGSWAEARKRGWIEIKGRDYAMEDRDVIEFKI